MRISGQNQHHTDASIFNDSLQIMENEIQREDTIDHKLQWLCQGFEQQKTFIKNLQNKVIELEKANNELTKKVKALKNTRDDTIEDLQLRQLLQESSTKNGRLCWKINNFRHRRQEAIAGTVRALHSAPCFTSDYGYKYCLRLFPDGDGIGKGQFLSLYLVIMRSEYDNILKWPCQMKLKVTLINQQSRCKDLVEIVSSTGDSPSFKQPSDEMNLPVGLPRLISIDDLENGFIKDDCIFIDVQFLENEN